MSVNKTRILTNCYDLLRLDPEPLNVSQNKKKNFINKMIAVELFFFSHHLQRVLWQLKRRKKILPNMITNSIIIA